MSDSSKPLPVAALERIDAKCQRFESQWKAGAAPVIEELVRDVAGDERSTLLAELILLDMEYRRRLGESPTTAEYLNRFPEARRKLLDRSESRHPTPPVAAFDMLTKQDQPLPSPDLNAGTVIGSYRIQRVLGRGGMGTVYAAEHQHLKRSVALKLQKRNHAADERHLKRFRKEAELIARLSHPNIVIAHDAGDFEGRPFLVTELVDGSDLSKEVRESGPLQFDDAIRCVRDAASGLAYAHQQGIIHRDVKPSNLLRAKTGSIKVSDLGLARFRLPDPIESLPDADDTSPGMAMGTVDYISPEQARDPSSADARSDIYSLGCTLFFLVTGGSVYKGVTPLERLLAHASTDVPDLCEQCAECPEWSGELVARMIAKSPEDRVQSMQDVIAAIDAEVGNNSFNCRVRDSIRSENGSGNSKKATHSPIAKNAFAVLATLALGVTAFLFIYFIRPHDPPTLSEEDASEKISSGEMMPEIPVVPFDNASELQQSFATAIGVPLTTSVGNYELVLIPPGEFQMGATEEQIKRLKGMGAGVDYSSRFDEPAHVVTIRQPFYMGKTEVTVDQFTKFVEATKYITTIEKDRQRESGGRPKCEGYGRVDGKWTRSADFDWQNIGEVEFTGDMPVMNVSHHDAVAFTKWLSTTDASHRYRLPTQAEWEYACRAGTDTIWYYGDSLVKHGRYGWNRSNSNSRPHPVATTDSNPFGLFDMYGNVDEWCGDLYRSDAKRPLVKLKEGQTPHPSMYNAVAARGGSFVSDLGNRTTTQNITAREGAGLRGFRVVREIAVD